MEICGAIWRGARGHTPSYRVNIWGLRKPETNKKEGWQMVEQQVRYILRHLKDAHQIEEHQTLAGSPTGTSSQTLHYVTKWVATPIAPFAMSK